MRTLTASLTALLLVLTSSLYTQSDFKLGFTGAYPQYYDYNTTKNISWQNYHDLGLNQWQGWWIGDNWHTNATEEVLGKLAQENIDGWLQPDTIRWAGYGRIQVNEAENDAGIRFGYNEHHSRGIPVTDNWQNTTQRVQYYEAIPNAPGSEVAILTDVKEKGFQSFSGVPNDPVYQVSFPYNDYFNPNYPLANPIQQLNYYYVKPRMRINASDINTSKPVVKIIVKAFKGNTVLERVINTDDFKDANGNYDGRYLEEYLLISLQVRGDIINSIGETGGRLLNDPAELPNCHVDYQIYWYGEVSVWIDYVKVMDEAAYMLFNEGQDGIRLRNAIEQKINYIKSKDQGSRMKGFYMEEIDYSNLACLKYLNDNMPVWANDEDYKVIGLLNPGSYQAHLTDKWYLQAYEEYISLVDPPEVMVVRYCFTGDIYQQQYRVPLPDNLNQTVTFPTTPVYNNNQALKNEIQGIYYAGTIRMSPPNYNLYLQNSLTNHGTLDELSSLCSLISEYSKAAGKKMFFVPQVIFWHWKNSCFWMREPLNSEIGVQIGIALCNGAKGILECPQKSGQKIKSDCLSFQIAQEKDNSV